MTSYPVYFTSVRNGLILLLILLSSINLKGQEETTDFQFWLNYALTVQINNKLSYGGDAGFRGFISNKD